MTSVKVRIYDLARELGTPNKILIDTLKDKLNITVKSHSSTIDAKHIEKLKILIKELNNEYETPKEASEAKEATTEGAKPIKQDATTITEPEHKIETKKIETPTITKETIAATKEPELARPLETKPIEEKPVPSQPQGQRSTEQRGTKPSQIPTPNRPNKEQPQQNTDTKPTYGINKQQGSTDATKKPIVGDRPYHVSGNKYKYRPDNKTKPGQKPEFKQGQKPGYRHGQKPGLKQSQQIESSVEQIPEETIEVQTIKQEVTLQETTKQEVTQQEVTKQEITPQEVTKQEATKQEATKQEVTRQEVTKQGFTKQEARPINTSTQGPKRVFGEHRAPDRGPKPPTKDFQPVRPGEKFLPQNKDKAAFKHKKAEGFTKPLIPKIKPEGEEGSGIPKPSKHKVFKKKDIKNKFVETKPLEEILRRKKVKKEIQEIVKPTEVLIDAPLTVGELAEKLHLSAAEVITELIKAGIFATLNETISEELAKVIAENLEYTVLTEDPKKAAKEAKEKEDEAEEAKIEKPKKAVSQNSQERAPIVTILGHVDHGKTTLLDAIRKTKHNLVDGEVGGITQSIGAYTVVKEGKKIVFIDTPGHQAFTAMRARGAKVTDIAILIVAADDGIMPQTVEAINHAKAAKVPIIVAINKIDKAGVDPDRILQQLTEHNLIPEDWGGDTVTVKISAIKGLHIDELLDMISLVAEMQELKADPTLPATGVVVESELDKGKGAIARVLVQNGTLRVGDYVAVGSVAGKIRALLDDYGVRINEAGPSTPVEILGLSEVPTAGDSFEAIVDEKTLKQIIIKRKLEERNKRLGLSSPIKLQKDTIFKAKQKKQQVEVKELNVVIKADTDGSAKAVESTLQELKSKEVVVKIIHSGVGDISETDIMLAATSNAIVIGFGVKEDQNAAKISEEEKVSIRTYDIIYQISEDIEKTMLGLLEPEFKEIELGTAEVRDIFTIGKNTVIAGCYVLEGKIVRNKQATVYRDNKEIHKGTLDNLKRFKDDAKEVAAGYECGISFNKFNNIEKGDIIKVTAMEEIERDSL